MPTATLLNTTGCYRGTSAYSSNDSPFMLGKTADYTMRGRVGFAPLDKSWYIKSIKLYMNRTDGYAGKTLKVGTSLSSAWGAALDWSQNIYASKGTGAKAWDLTAYKDILQGYSDGFYFHFTHGSGDSSYCEWTAGSGSGAPRLVVEYEEATLTVPGGEFTIGAQAAITVGTAGSGLTHKLSYAIGTASGALNCGASIDAGGTVNWTPDAALANQITDAMVGSVTLTLESYLDSALSSTVTLSYPLNVPASYVPTIGSTVFAVSNPAGDEIGIYVQGRSRSVCTISASSVYGASIVEYRLTLGGKTYISSSSPITTDVLSLPGALTAGVTVVDSRGQTATLTQAAAVTVHAYAAPMITAFSVTRALADGTATNEGTHIKFTIACVFAPLANKNSRAGSIKFKLAGGEYSVPVPLTDAMAALGATAYSFTLTGVLGDGAIGSGSYVVSATLTDRYTTSSAEAELAGRTIYFDLHSSGEGVAIGKVAETPSLFDVGLASRFRGTVNFEGAVGFGGAVNFDIAPGFADAAAAREKLGIQMGTVSTTLPVNATKTGVVTFPNAYATAPLVMLTMDYLGSAGTGTVIKLFVVGCTATTFTWYIASSGSSAVACNVWWVAFGEPVAE